MKKNKYVLLFAIVVLLLVGVASASDVELNDTTDTMEASTTTITSTVDANEAVQKDINIPIEDKEIMEEKTITKKNENNVKTASKTYDNTNTFSVLEEAITSSDYDVVTINITSDITLEKNLEFSSVIKNLSIYGNNHTINGNGEYRFLKIGPTQTVNINYITISNCFNQADGGAINNKGTLTITQSTFENNKAGNSGGAINNNGTLTITQSTLQNNKAIGGGAIYNIDTLTITQSTLQNNSVTDNGGAIYNQETATITQSTLQNNYAKQWGGAIFTRVSLKITDSTLQNNKANYGGAIFCQQSFNVLNCTFENNTASLMGGAISRSKTLEIFGYITNSSFIGNHAQDAAAVETPGFMNFSGNKFIDNRAANAETISSLYSNLIFKDNVYEHNDILLSEIKISVNQNIFQYGDDVNLTYTLTVTNFNFYLDFYNGINDVTLYLNGEKNVMGLQNPTLSNLAPGKYSAYFTTCTRQSNTVNFIVEGDSEITTDKESYDYYEGKKEYVTLLITDYNERGSINITVNDGDNIIELLNYQNVKDGYKISTDALFDVLQNNFEDLNSSYTLNVSFDSDILHPSSTTFTLNIIEQRNTTIQYDIINNTEGNVQINITVLDQIYNTPITDAQIQITGDITQNTTTGIITDNTLTPGSYTINIKYDETNDYKSSETTINFNVEIDKDKQIEELEEELNEANTQIENLTNIIENLTKPKETTITIDPLENIKYGDEIIITGLLVNEDSISLSNQPVTIVFNDEQTSVTTRNGEFKYTTTAKVLGENTITATYAGSDKYRESTATYTFEVAKADTVITIDDIEAVKKGETVTITGALTDHNGNALANKVVRLLINNGRKTLKTDADGVYTFDYALTRIGENTITATFEGDDYYTESTETITVETLALSSVITIDPVDTIVKGTKATFTGTLMDENGEAIANAQVKLNINGNTKTLKTDSEGRFTHTFTMNTVGENIITATYAGSASYEAAEAEITVEVVKAEAVITLDPIESVTKGDNATFTGKLTDANGKAIANAQVRITINGSPKTLRTDENGVFTHTFKMIKEGTNNITAVFNGNNDFAAAETSSTVEVVKAE